MIEHADIAPVVILGWRMILILSKLLKSAGWPWSYASKFGLIKLDVRTDYPSLNYWVGWGLINVVIWSGCEGLVTKQFSNWWNLFFLDFRAAIERLFAAFTLAVLLSFPITSLVVWAWLIRFGVVWWFHFFRVRGLSEFWHMIWFLDVILMNSKVGSILLLHEVLLKV